MLLTEAQLHEIHDIIRDHHYAFVINTIGPDAVAPEILEDLKTKGLVNVQISSIEEAYLYGQVLAALESSQAAAMGYDEFKAHMKKNPVPLSPAEKQAISMAKIRAGQLAVGLGNRVDSKTGALLIEADAKLRSKMRHQIREKTSENIARRESVQKLKSDLGHATKDWARDWDRIAVTEKQTAMQTGLADTYSKKYGPDVLVAKRPMPDACQHCKRLHLGPDGLPRIFKLSELEANGTNQGKKAANWLPTVGPVHPHCFVSGTLVTTMRGQIPIETVRPGDMVLDIEGAWQPVTHSWASVHVGNVVRVSTLAGDVEATPEHPFRLGGKWLRADELRKGDQLIGATLDPLSVDADAKDLPSELAKVPRLARILFGFTRRGVPVSAIDLDGELYVREGQVDQESAHLVAGDRFEAGKYKGVEDLSFGARFELASLRCDGGDHEVRGLFLPANGGVESGDIFAPLFWRHVGHTDGLALTSPARLMSAGNQASDNSSASGAQPASYFLHREQFVEVHVDNSGNVQFAPKRSARHADAVTQVRSIVNVSSRRYEGLVYNLTVGGTHTFVANGLVVHNCQCQLVRVPPGWGFDKEGDLRPGAIGGHAEHYEKSLDGDDLVKAFKSGTNIDFQGFAIHVENAVGSVRHWGSGEHAGTTEMHAAYGYLADTQGADGEEIDCYVGTDETAENVYIVEQQNPHTGLYDEAKCMIGFESREAAEAMYRIHYNRPDFMLYTTAMEVDQFVRWIYGTNDTDDKKLPNVTAPMLVVPLAKARISAEAAAQDSLAGARNPGPGTVTNFIVRTPVRETAPPVEGLKEILETGHGADEREAIKRDKEIYEVHEPFLRVPKPIILPENFGGVDDLGQGHAEERKADVARRYRKNVPPGNPVEIEKPKFTIAAREAAKPDEKK